MRRLRCAESSNVAQSVRRDLGREDINYRVELAFEALTPLGFQVRCTREWWEYIVSFKHPILRDRLKDVVATLTQPLEIRRSTRDAAVLLFYRTAAPRLLCAVIRRDDGSGFLITAYPTDALKRGDVVWSASR